MEGLSSAIKIVPLCLIFYSFSDIDNNSGLSCATGRKQNQEPHLSVLSLPLNYQFPDFTTTIGWLIVRVISL